MALTKIGSIGINTGIQFAGVTTIATLNASDNVLSVGGTVNFVSDVSIGGTVSIAGTLTYEDVTNVDAVGLITARNGIVVGSGITLNSYGDSFFTGVTTSTTFVSQSSLITGDLTLGDKIIHDGDSNTAIRFPSADTITAETGGSERLRITSAGLVGINETSPDSPLHVSTNTDGTTDILTLHADADGTNNGVSSIKLMGNTGNHAAFIKGGHTTNGDTILTFHTDAHDSGINPEERLRIDSGGRLLVGDSNATGAAIVQVQKTSGDMLLVRNHATNYESLILSVASGTADIYASSGGSTSRPALRFITNDAERLRITSDGSVRIPDGGASTGRLSLGTDEDLKIYHSGSDAFVVNATGNLDIRSNGSITLYNSAGTEVMATFTADGSSELRHNNNYRLTTNSAGVDVRNETECFFKIARTNDSPSDNDYVGNLEFLGKDSGNNFTSYGKIVTQIIDQTDGTEDGRMIMQSMKEGTMTTAATIEHGYFQRNTAPGYFGDNAAWTSSNPNMHNPSLKWTSGDYVSSTGVFTCPVAGKYLCSATVQAHRANNNSGGSSTYYNVLWQKNSGNYHIEMVGTIATNAGALGVNDVNGKHAQVTATVLMDCAKGDTIRAHSNHGYRNASQNIVGVILIA